MTAAEAARGGEVVIVTIPQRAVPDLPTDLFAGVPENKAFNNIVYRAY